MAAMLTGAVAAGGALAESDASVIGAAFHNLGQLLVAMVIT